MVVSISLQAESTDAAPSDSHSDRGTYQQDPNKFD